MITPYVLTPDIEWMYSHASRSLQNKIFKELIDETGNAYACYVNAINNGIYEEVLEFRKRFLTELTVAHARRIDYRFTYRDAVLYIANRIPKDFHKELYVRVAFTLVDDTIRQSFVGADGNPTQSEPGLFYKDDPNSILLNGVKANNIDFFHLTIPIKQNGKLVFIQEE